MDNLENSLIDPFLGVSVADFLATIDDEFWTEVEELNAEHVWVRQLDYIPDAGG